MRYYLITSLPHYLITSLPHCLISDRNESTGEVVIHHLHGKLNERIPQRIDTGQIDALVAGSSVRC
ncbi:TPA: hypothetical protein O4H39_001510 [Vibrio alginolyticus]|nr:hypothetical protein [Vibrio alginolyticus]HCZ9394307.1 hypothetical protein [Vibrio alginolyticus]